MTEPEYPRTPPPPAGPPTPPASGSPVAKTTMHTAKSNGPKRPRFLRIGRTNWIAGGVAGVVLLGSGIALGTTLPNPTASEQYVELSADMEDLEAEKAAIEIEYTDLETAHDIITSQLDERNSKLDERELEVGKAEEKAELAAADVKKREKAVTGAEKKKAANTVSEGQWTVGKDIEPGTYRVIEPIASRCYWVIHASGTNGTDIIANDLPTGGSPMVTLAVGQDFTTKRCGSWQKQ